MLKQLRDIMGTRQKTEKYKGYKTTNMFCEFYAIK